MSFCYVLKYEDEETDRYQLSIPIKLKGLSHEIFRPVFWPVWVHLGLTWNCLWFKNFYEAPSIFGNYFKFWCASYQTFSEICRISEKDWQLSYRNAYVVEERSRRTAELVVNILGDSTNLREVLTPFAAFLGGPLTQNKQKLENRVLNCQSFSEILRLSEKVWYETHQYLK